MLQTKDCQWLAKTYHPNQSEVLEAADAYSPEQFIRLFLTAHGMPPIGTWQTHTYARVTDSITGKDHFFLIPMPSAAGPIIRFEEGVLWIDHIQTAVRPQSIPYTTPFWYFHYNPNHEDRPFSSMTLNLKPACPEKCTLCAGAKTGRVNNGTDGALSTDSAFQRIFLQHPAAPPQLDSVAVVTGCFDHFDALASHLKDVRNVALKYSAPKTFRVLEHNVTTEEQFDVVVRELGYDVFITLECFDQNKRKIALNGNVGRKGRNSAEFLNMIHTYANYLEARPELGKRFVRVTYLMGIDSLETSETLFQQMAALNQKLKNVSVIPWLSVFTPYDKSMRVIQQKDFSLRFLIDAQRLCKKYFAPALLDAESGSTADGYARGLF